MLRNRTVAIVLLAALALIAAVSPLTAADMPLKNLPLKAAPPMLTWTGFYVGADVGYGWSNPRDVAFTPNDPAAVQLFVPAAGGQPPPISYRGSGGLGGLQAGYNYQPNPRWLVGFEADFQWSGVKGSGASSGIVVGIPFSETMEERVKWFGTVRGRFGVLPTDNLMVFVTGGLAYAKVEQSATWLLSGAGAIFANAGGFSFLCFQSVPASSAARTGSAPTASSAPVSNIVSCPT
jgi:outer membrane immunogenic protein